jgi:hypothetical protein
MHPFFAYFYCFYAGRRGRWSNFILQEAKDAGLQNLTAILEAEKFKYAQFHRMIYGSKRERFISNDFPE